MKSDIDLQNPLVSGDLVEIHSWRKRYEPPRIGVIVKPVCEAAVYDFSRYDVLIDDEVVTVRRDMLQKVKRTI
tara:strand:+ start:255 stop:473 length:219 start_codon:yes stop_codon:yes gene_type:complete